MRIVQASDAIHLRKPEGTDVHYYLFKDYEVHQSDQAPHTTQTWHHHDVVWETLFIFEGEMTAHWREGDTERTQIVRPGDLIETEHSPHTFSNDSDQVARFLVIKRIPSPKDYSETFKNDKILD